MADSVEQSSIVSHRQEDGGTSHVGPDAIRPLHTAHPNAEQEQAEAKAALDAEKHMTVRQAIRLYRKAILFSMAMSLAVVMEG